MINILIVLIYIDYVKYLWMKVYIDVIIIAFILVNHVLCVIKKIFIENYQQKILNFNYF